ncbi:R-spondin-3 isoform X1 [Rissa tridactyla]|uniref:R-spondin-3 isoform X1 n=1 Tax=Rissa tridactyla TaxID=75485 RepID=UPI0023BA7D45|nr:R-spondin-3 isoform X1 [Rissa tridactyla]
MQLRLISWFFITLNFMEYIGSHHASRVRRQGRMHSNVSQGCQGGCATCSDYNGCLSCKPRLFFVLERIGMKQIGVCLSSCPSGYYGTRYPDINKCAKCKADCDTCFTRNFCTKCKSGFYLYSGKCLEKCPDGLEANNHTMECTSIVHCEASEWSPWSPCTKKGKTCGFKRGNEVRVREIVQHPSARGNPCPATSESRKCIVQRKRCQKEGKGFTKAPIDVVVFGLERTVPLPGVNKVLTLLKKCALCDLERTGWAGWEGTLSLGSAERAAKMRSCMWSSEQKAPS